MQRGFVRTEGDLYDISARVREIDDRYVLMRRVSDGSWHLFAEGAHVCALPYRELDARSIEHVRRTRIERAQALVEEIERENAALRIREEKERAKRIAAAAEEAYESKKSDRRMREQAGAQTAPRRGGYDRVRT